MIQIEKQINNCVKHRQPSFKFNLTRPTLNLEMNVGMVKDTVMFPFKNSKKKLKDTSSLLFLQLPIYLELFQKLHPLFYLLYNKQNQESAITILSCNTNSHLPRLLLHYFYIAISCCVELVPNEHLFSISSSILNLNRRMQPYGSNI